SSQKLQLAPWACGGSRSGAGPASSPGSPRCPSAPFMMMFAILFTSIADYSRQERVSVPQSLGPVDEPGWGVVKACPPMELHLIRRNDPSPLNTPPDWIRILFANSNFIVAATKSVEFTPMVMSSARNAGSTMDPALERRLVNPLTTAAAILSSGSVIAFARGNA